MPELIVLREAGGIGDVARLGAILDALAARHTGRLVACLHRGFLDTARLCPSVAAGRWELVGLAPERGERRTPAGRPIARWASAAALPYADPAMAPPSTPVLDLFCPALRHEIQTAGRVTMDRLECWGRAAGVWPIAPGNVRLSIPHACLRGAREWRAGVRRPLVALSAKSNASIRTWRNGTAGGHRTGRVGALVAMLRRRGWKVALFGPADAPSDLPGDEADLAVQAARLSVCDLFIGPDSGMLHLACAAGVPAVGIFGPTNGEAVLRCYDNPRRIVSGRWTDQIRSRVGCDHACYGFAHAGYRPRRCGGSCRVLEGVMEETVVEAARELIEHPRSLLVRR